MYVVVRTITLFQWYVIHYSSEMHVVMTSIVSCQVIPAGLSAKYCGHVYLIVFIDNTGDVDEITEYNNQRAVEIFIQCPQGVYAGPSFPPSLPASLPPFLPPSLPPSLPASLPPSLPPSGSLPLLPPSLPQICHIPPSSLWQFLIEMTVNCNYGKNNKNIVFHFLWQRLVY